MKRVSREFTVAPEVRHKVREPVAEVELGETFVVETINFRTPVIRMPENANPEVYKERKETGPIFVKGIEAGDILAIEILDGYDPYAIPEARAILEGGVAALAEVYQTRGVELDPDGYYSICDMCTSLRRGDRNEQKGQDCGHQ